MAETLGRQFGAEWGFETAPLAVSDATLTRCSTPGGQTSNLAALRAA
jgi:hypothetical protein